MPDGIGKGLIVINSFAATIVSVWGSVWPILVAILLFVLIIVIHEFGHFISAKLLDVRVNEFAVGFGPRLFKKKKGETEYSIRLIPFGGYCAMEGEDEDSADPRAFGNKKPWRKFIIVAAGALFNILLGFILAVCIVLPQKQFTTTTVDDFAKGAVSQSTGLKAGDQIVGVNGRRVYTTYDLSYIFATDADGKFDMSVKRGDKTQELKDVTFAQEKAEDGKQYIKLDFYVKAERKTFFTTIKQSFLTTVSYGRVVYMSLFDLVTGKFGISALSGPVGVTKAIGDAAKSGIGDFLNIACLITINLGIMNLLPIPALDGGRLLFIVIEGIRKKPVPAKYEGMVHAIGFALVFALLIFVTANDILKLIIPIFI